MKKLKVMTVVGTRPEIIRLSRVLMALENSEIVERTIDKHFIISFEYANMNKVMRIIKEKNLLIIAQKMEMDCEIEIATRKKNVQNLLDTFENLYEIKLIEI